MIKVDLFNNEAVICTVNGSRQSFFNALDTIKNLPVREYKKETKQWIVPISDIVILKKRCGVKKIDFKYTSEVRGAFQNHLEWRNEQANIKAGTDYSEEFEEYTKEKMYPFQTVGAKFAYEAKDAMILDQVGLGKTVQSIAVQERHFGEKTINFCIVICPSTLKRNWEDEIEKFSYRDSIVIGGARAKRKKQYKNAYKYDYMIINYDLLHHDIQMIDELILQRGYEFGLIIDEIQYIKNHTAKRSRITKQISYFSVTSIGLSATVIENNVIDLWSSFQAISPYVYGDKRSHGHFLEQFVITDFFGNATGYKNGKLIKSKKSPYTIRRFKEDVLQDLPDRIENNFWVELAPEQRKIYNEVKNNITSSISDMEKAGRIQMAEILPMITYLRQCVLSAKLVGAEENISTKTVQLLDFMLNSRMEGHPIKMVIFSFFVDMVEILYDELTAVGFGCMAMHGKKELPHHAKLDDRVAQIKEFNQSDELDILITSDILATGVNITSANYLVNFDLLFNPAKIEQRIGRADRIGNVHDVLNVINFIATDTIEEEIWKTLHHKKQMSIDLIDDFKIEERLTIKSVKSLLNI